MSGKAGWLVVVGDSELLTLAFMRTDRECVGESASEYVPVSSREWDEVEERLEAWREEWETAWCKGAAVGRSRVSKSLREVCER